MPFFFYIIKEELSLDLKSCHVHLSVLKATVLGPLDTEYTASDWSSRQPQKVGITPVLETEEGRRVAQSTANNGKPGPGAGCA